MIKFEKNKVILYREYLEIKKPYPDYNKYRYLERPSKKGIVISDKPGWIFNYLNEKVSFDKKLILADFFKHLIKHKENINIFFPFALNGIDFNEVVKDYYRKLKKFDDENDTIIHFDLSWNSKIIKDKISFKPYFDCTYLNPVKRSLKGKYIKGIIDYIPLAELKKYPLKIYNKVYISKSASLILNYSNYKEQKEEDISYKLDFTLFDIIHAILYRITLLGTTADKYIKYSEFAKEEIKSLEVNVKNIIDNIGGLENLKKEKVMYKYYISQLMKIENLKEYIIE